jgi:hypothetical protein
MRDVHLSCPFPDCKPYLPTLGSAAEGLVATGRPRAAVKWHVFERHVSGAAPPRLKVAAPH